MSAKSASHPSSYHVIVLDVDSKDLSLAISAPPMSFLTLPCLTDMFTLLAPCGVLVVNLVVRSRDSLKEVLLAFKHIFVDSKCYVTRPSEENVNITLHVVKGPFAISTTSSASTGKSSSKMAGVGSAKTIVEKGRAKLIGEWLAVIGLPLDPLDLGGIVPLMEEYV